MRTITHAFDVSAPPEAVYEALTTEKGLSGWWTRTAEVDREADRTTVDFRFGSEFFVRMAVEERGEARSLRWQCREGADDWTDSSIRFELQRRDRGTLILFEHEFARAVEREAFGRYNFNWAYYLQSLKALCETGQGFPFEGA